MGISPNVRLGEVWSPEQWNLFLSNKADDLPYAKMVPVNGQTVLTPLGTGILILVPTAELLSLTVVAPPGALDRQVFRVTTTQGIDSFQVTPAISQSVVGGGPLVMSSNSALAWVYVVGDLAWYRIQ